MGDAGGFGTIGPPTAQEQEKTGFLQSQTHWKTPFQSLPEEREGAGIRPSGLRGQEEVCLLNTEKGSKAVPLLAFRFLTFGAGLV